MSQTATSTPVVPGEILAGKYRIERLLGEGAMGIVVAARHLLLEQFVAIKFLRPELAEEPGVSERFRREAKAAARIKGEHVVRVFDVGETDSGLPYLVMEYVEGRNLAEVIAAEGALPTPVAVDYILQACDALAQAHAAGIVHRDVKPSNLFVSHRPDGRPLVKVLDFGISKVTGVEAAMTQPTALMGSPLYMSPEQLLSSRDVDGRSDIWSLGIVLHELLAGSAPFTGDTIPQICMQIQDAPAPALRTARPEISEDLEAVVLRCLEKDPALRFATVPQVVSALRSVATKVRQPRPVVNTQYYDAEVPASVVGAGSQRGRGTPSTQQRSSSMLRTIVVASALMIGAAATVALIVLFRADREDPTPPEPAVPSERSAAATSAPSLPPAPSPSVPAPSPTVANGSPATSPEPAPSPSSDTTAGPLRSGGSPPVNALKAKARSTLLQKRFSPRPDPRAVPPPSRSLRAAPALPGDRK